MVVLLLTHAWSRLLRSIISLLNVFDVCVCPALTSFRAVLMLCFQKLALYLTSLIFKYHKEAMDHARRMAVTLFYLSLANKSLRRFHDVCFTLPLDSCSTPP